MMKMNHHWMDPYYQMGHSETIKEHGNNNRGYVLSIYITKSTLLMSMSFDDKLLLALKVIWSEISSLFWLDKCTVLFENSETWCEYPVFQMSKPQYIYLYIVYLSIWQYAHPEHNIDFSSLHNMILVVNFLNISILVLTLLDVEESPKELLNGSSLPNGSDEKPLPLKGSSKNQREYILF